MSQISWRRLRWLCLAGAIAAAGYGAWSHMQDETVRIVLANGREQLAHVDDVTKEKTERVRRNIPTRYYALVHWTDSAGARQDRKIRIPFWLADELKPYSTVRVDVVRLRLMNDGPIRTLIVQEGEARLRANTSTFRLCAGAGIIALAGFLASFVFGRAGDPTVEKG